MIKRIFTLLIIALIMTLNCYSQTNLVKRVSLHANGQSLEEVLNQLAKAGDFTFSYNTEILSKSNLITFRADNIMVQDILDTLLNDDVEYKEASNYIILRACPNQLTFNVEKSEVIGNKYLITGYVVDSKSGSKIKNASVYQKESFESTLTNVNGYFKLIIRSEDKIVRITITKEKYREITLNMLPSVTIVKDTVNYNYRPDKGLEMTFFGKIFVSSKQRIQNINLSGFFKETPVQLSFLPGLSSHGISNSQMVSKLSLNVLGGYSAGVKGAEFGGLFNIDKYDVGNFQAAGLINVVGGRVKGLQIAGIGNAVLDSLQAVQAAGIFNVVIGNTKGSQFAGIVNLTTKNLKGNQFAGIGNATLKAVNGWQVAGIFNAAIDTVKGVQISGIVNYAKKNKGLQLGLINITDSLEGYSIGLLNLSKNGYHKIELSANDVTNFNVNIKTGNAKIYSTIYGGLNLLDNAKVLSYGAGLGHDFILNKKNLLISLEFSTHYLYLGDKSRNNLLNKASLALRIPINKYLSVYTGPNYAVYYSNQTNGVPGYKSPSSIPGFGVNNFNDKVKGWIGWHFGLSLF